MNTTLGAGLVLSAVGLAAYVAGIWIAYPARSLSVAAVMVGLTLAAIGRSNGLEGSA
jgi:hypothetical protein